MLIITDSENSLNQSWWRSSPYISYFIVFIAGGVLPLAFSPINYYFISVLSPSILFYFFIFANSRQAAWLGWWYGLGFFGVGVSWVFVAIYEFGLSSMSLSLVLTFISISLLALFIAFQGFITKIFINKFNLVNQKIIILIVFPLFWVLMEWIRGWFLTGFPWLSLGYSQTNSMLSGYAAVLGVYGVSWIVALSAALLLLAVLYKKERRSFLYFIGGLSVIWMAGAFLFQVEWTQITDKALKVSLVQGNVEQKNKWDPEHFEKRKQRYLSLTRQHWDSDLVIWPENSLTIFYHQLKNDFLIPLQKEAEENNTDIILGLPVLDRTTKEYFSSLMAFNRAGDEDSKIQFYHKSHLVPFGEYVPLASMLRGLISFFDLPMSGFTPGKKDQKLLTAAGQRIAPTICYEDAFGEDVIRFLPEASLVLNASNNAWYGDSFAPHQHLQISQMRALETGRDVMRVTTNGVSALINYKGEITARSPQFKSYVITGFVQPRGGSTPYVRWGNYFILMLMFFGLIVSVVFGRTSENHN